MQIASLAMDVRRLESRLLEESLQDLPRRAQLLESKLALCDLEERPPSADIGRELDYLGRIASRDAQGGAGYRELLARLSARAERCEQPPSRSPQSQQSSDPSLADVASCISTAACSADAASTSQPPRANERLAASMQLVSLSETIMRREITLDSAEVKVLAPNTHAWVQMLGDDPEGRRICIEDEDYDTGWVSVVTKKGEWLWKEEGKDPFEDIVEYRLGGSSGSSSGAGSGKDGSPGLAVNVAAFLRPSVSARHGGAATAAAEAAQHEDAVRLLAAEGQLASELSRYPIFAVPGKQSALLFRSWTDEDDAESRARERIAILELSHAVANLHELQELVGSQIEASQGALDQIEQHMANTRDETEQVVAVLSKAGPTKIDRMKWLAPSVCFVVLSGLALHGAPVACASCMAVRGAAVAGATSLTGAGSLTLAEWQKKALAELTDHLPLAFGKIPEKTSQLLRACGDEAERRLLAKLADVPSWSRVKKSLEGYNRKLPVWERGANARTDGHAYATSFEVDLPARLVFQTLQRLGLAGSLDPGCEGCWSCPVDESGETLMRYLVFSRWSANRDFYVVCRCARAQPDRALNSSSLGTGEIEEMGLPKYVFAVTSVSADLLEESELPRPKRDAHHGQIHVCGVAVTQLESGGSCIEVMADVDPRVSFLPTVVVDRDVRLHVLYTAGKMAEDLKKVAWHDETGSSATG